MAEEGSDFFVSYAQADRAWAEWIAWQLKGAGQKVVLQAWDFGLGSDWVYEMHKAAATAKRTIAVLSGSYLRRYMDRRSGARPTPKTPRES